MKTKAMQSFESACERARIFVENDMPIGVFHDFLLEIKGMMVDRMIAAHRQELETAEEQKKQEEVQPCEGCQGE